MWKKIYYSLTSFLVVYIISLVYALVIPSVNFVIGKEYRSLVNWDLPSHQTDDFDGDGKKDLISFTGCAFLSTKKEKSIPEGQQCRARGISHFVFTEDKIGQKFLKRPTEDFSLDYASNPFHAYMTKPSDKWLIHVNDLGRGGLLAFEIEKDGSIKPTQNGLLLDYVNEFIYSASWFGMFVVILISYPLTLLNIAPMFGVLVYIFLWIITFYKYKDTINK